MKKEFEETKKKLQEKSKKIRDKSKKSFLKFIFGRTVIISVFLIIEILFLLVVLKWFQDKAYLIIGSTHIVTALMMIYLINDRQDPTVKITWIIIIMFLPFFGTLMYWYIHTDIGHRIIKKRLSIIKDTYKDTLLQNEVTIKELEENKEYDILNVAKYMKNYGNYNIYKDTQLKYFKIGEEMFVQIIEELKKAKHFIFLEYFIIDKGYMWQKILNILKEKAKEGVEVRLLYDGMCAFSMLPYNYPQELEKYGIKAKMFAPIRPFLSTYYNNRDHRKILVIDGITSFTGGINLADEYINLLNRFGHWKDTGIMLKGEATKEFTRMFLELWNSTESEYENIDRYLEMSKIKKYNGYVMAYSDSPFDGELFAENIYIDIINTAKKYIYIATPYFVPDNRLLSSLILASKKNIDVRLVLPHIPDKKVPFALAHSYYKELLEMGIKIYEYTPGFVHAKMIISDDIKVIVGTINFDYRSLYHNFECATYIYKNNDIINDIKNDFEDNLFKKSQEIDYNIVKKEKLMMKILGKVLKIFAILI